MPSMDTTHSCQNKCVLCSKDFTFLDNPKHIGGIKNIEKQIGFLNSKYYLYISLLV